MNIELSVGELYVSEKEGSDESGDGTEKSPFKTILQAMRHVGKEPFPNIYVDSKEDGKVSVCFINAISLRRCLV